MQQKTKRIIHLTAAIVPALMVIGSGLGKLAGAKPVVEKLKFIGVGDYIPLLGIMEIVFAVLFIIPKTSRLGFILLSCYFAGAIAVDLSHQQSIVPPLMLMALVWIGAFIRDASVFMPSAKNKEIMASA